MVQPCGIRRVGRDRCQSRQRGLPRRIEKVRVFRERRRERAWGWERRCEGRGGVGWEREGERVVQGQPEARGGALHHGVAPQVNSVSKR